MPPQENTIRIREVTENKDGSVDVDIDISDEFKDWFKREQNLQRWSQKRFQEWLLLNLQHLIEPHREA